MKKILYVDVDPLKYKSEGSQERARQEQDFIAEGLSKKFDVTSTHNFLSDSVDRLLHQGFDGMVTHTPYSTSRYFPYEKSLFKLDFLHRIYPSLPIVIYTGASPGDVNDEEFRKRGAQGIVRKHSVEEDLPQLLSALEQIIL